MKRLCEIQAGMRDALLEIGLRELEGYKLLRKWAGMKCPNRDHCDPSRKCEGLTPLNLVTISQLEDALFVRGYVNEKEK